ncbi:MAG: hypothetical protein ACRD68_15500 [Pyrinomonadaceae bacterium]
MPFFRTIVEDYEAWLEPCTLGSHTQRARGKVERERFGNGEEEFELRFRRLHVPDGAVVEVVVGARVLGSVTVARGRGKLLLTNKGGAEVPSVAAGEVVEVRHMGFPLLRGTFRED